MKEPRPWRHAKWLLVSAAVLAGAVAAIVYLSSDELGGDVADRPSASVWVRSQARRARGSLELDVDTSSVIVRDGSDVLHPPWTYVASKIESSITQVGDENSAPQAVKGTVAYVVMTPRWNFLKLRRDLEVTSCTFEFTGDFTQEPDGVRWWRVKRVDPRADARKSDGD